jgi:hypothetical protein
MINEFLQEYEAERQKILNNKDWTREGKQKAMEKLDREMKEEARILIRDLRKNAIQTAAILKNAQDTKELLTDEALKNLNYDRLNYEAQAVRSKIVSADSIFDVMDAWEQDQAKGDPYVIKAWKDTAAEPLAAKSEGGVTGLTEDKAKLIKSIAKAHVNLIDDQEIREIEQKAVEDLQEIKNQALTLGGQFDRDHTAVKRVMAGIGFSKGKIDLDFEPQAVAKWEDGKELMETPEQLAKRVEKEYQETAQEYVKWATDKFDVDLDPDFDDLTT